MMSVILTAVDNPAEARQVLIVLQGTSHRITSDYAKLEQQSCTEHVSNFSLHIIARIMAGHHYFSATDAHRS